MLEQKDMPARVHLALGVYIAALNAAIIFCLVRSWPVALDTNSTSGLSTEGRFFVSAALAGALGSYIHLATSFVDHTGNRRLNRNWAWWYFLRPWIGAALALVVYFVIRAGLITGAGENSTANLNPYGVGAIAALSGMFSKQATDKLREIFENLCATDRPSPGKNEPNEA